MTQEIKLPPLLPSVKNGGGSYEDYSSAEVAEYARSAVEADRHARMHDNAGCESQSAESDEQASRTEPSDDELRSIWRDIIRHTRGEEHFVTVMRDLLSRCGQPAASAQPVGTAYAASPMYTKGTTVAVFDAAVVPAGSKLYAAPVAASDVEDAERYRYVRTGERDVWCSSGDDLLTGERLDATIDTGRAAVQAQPDDAWEPEGPLGHDAEHAVLAGPETARAVSATLAQAEPVGYGVFWREGGQDCSTLRSSEEEALRTAVNLGIQGASIEPVFRGAAQSTQHPDDVAVDQFAVKMKAKMARSREKGRRGWETASAERLSRMLRDHVNRGDPVDVANFAMMLSQNGQKIAAPPYPPAKPDHTERICATLRWVIHTLTRVRDSADYPTSRLLRDYNSRQLTAATLDLTRLLPLLEKES